MAKIYLCARYDHHRRMELYAKLLEHDGHTVTSRWIHGHHVGGVDGSEHNLALEDWNDLDDADTVLCFTENSEVGYTRGGRHVELGIALATDKRILVIGPRENVFYGIDWISCYETFEEARGALKATYPNSNSNP